jgi:hypothetical protein
VYNQNGLEVYDPRFERPFFPQRPKIDHYASSPFGFKIINVRGSLQWEPATETDFRGAEAQRLGISVYQVAPKEPDCYCVLDPTIDNIDCPQRKCPQGLHCMIIKASPTFGYCSCI